MVLTDVLRRFGYGRPHLLVVEGPGGVAARLEVERLSRERGWMLVVTPADADLLIVTGASSAIDEHVARVWDQLPGPRSLVRLGSPEDAPAAMERAQHELMDQAAHRADVRRTHRSPPAPPADETARDNAGGGVDPHAGHNMAGMTGMDTEAADPHAGHDMSSMDMSAADPHAGHDMSSRDVSAADPHAGHDMSSMGGMGMPAGLAMASRAEDRDGLKLDVLTVPLGPVLAWWPAGLVVTTVLQGDVVQQARVEVLGDVAAHRAGWTAALRHLDPAAASAVVRLDALVRLLALAGWDGPRLSCQQLRDTLLAGSPTQQAAPEARRLVRRISRSRSLSRMTVGIPMTQGEDLTARYRRWGTEILAALDQGTLPPPADEAHALHQLPGLLTGTEFASARLVIAGLDLALSGADVRVDARV